MYMHHATKQTKKPPTKIYFRDITGAPIHIVVTILRSLSYQSPSAQFTLYLEVALTF